MKYGDSSCIEWIEIDPVKSERIGRLVPDKKTDYSEFVVSVLLKNNIPYSINGPNYKVWGYANTSEQPEFV